jgi:hypothetical protein
MAIESDILYRQQAEVMAHLSKHSYKIPEGIELEDLLRRRFRDSYRGDVWIFWRRDDDQIIPESVTAVPDTYRSDETLDCLFGRDTSENWIGGPFASHSVRCRRTPTSLYLPSLVEYPQWLQPPASTQHYSRYMAPFLAPPPTKFLGFYNPEGGADPRSIDLLISQALGKLQWARNSARPDSTYADFAQSIAELREVSQLVQLRSNRLLSLAGSAYLLWEFGWKPVLSDVSKLVNLASALKKRIDFLKANVGKAVKRKRTLFTFAENKGEVSSLTFGPPGTYRTVEPHEGEVPIHGRLTVSAHYHSRLSYDLPVDSAIEKWDEKAFRYLAGLQLDKTLIWEVTPFSWLVDWFTNLGDLVEHRWADRLLDVDIHQEWITIQAEFHQHATVRTVAGEISSPDIEWTTSHSERKDTFKYRMIPPADAPLELLNLVGFNGKQQAILAALLASKTK